MLATASQPLFRVALELWQSMASPESGGTSDQSVAHRNRLDFEMAATKQRRHPNKFSRRQFLSSEITAVGRVEFVVEGKIGASNLHVHEIVHRHARFHEGVLHMIQKQFDFFVEVSRGVSGFRINANASRYVQRIP